TTDLTTRNLLLQRQSEWENDLEATAVEINVKWFTHVIPNYPRRLTDLCSNEAGSVTAIYDEIETQTELKPVDVCPSRYNLDDLPTKTPLIS
ncbi:hypothetical protein B0J13DRAFT_424716, partial [Dactylonectria estremocensis]